jgi:hypothetical protein
VRQLAAAESGLALARFRFRGVRLDRLAYADVTVKWQTWDLIATIEGKATKFKRFKVETKDMPVRAWSGRSERRKSDRGPKEELQPSGAAPSGVINAQGCLA